MNTTDFLQRLNVWNHRDLQQALLDDQELFVGCSAKLFLSRTSGDAEERSQDLAVRLDDLPRTARLRLLLAPETHHRLCAVSESTQTDLLDFLEDALEAERLASGDDDTRRRDRELWTALGDRYFPPEGETGKAPKISAASLSGGTVVDHLSPWRAHDAVHFGVNLDDCVAMSEQFAGQTLRALEGGMALIDRSDVRLARFVRDNVRVVQLHRLAKGRQGLVATTGSFVGQIVIALDDTSPWTRIDAADSLVHEATHNFLFAYERWLPTIRDGAAARQKLLVSPWTGSGLSAYHLVHAVLVWYQLARFWENLVTGDPLDDARVRHLLARATKGFLGGTDLRDTLGQVDPAVHPFFVDLCAELQAEVRRDFRTI